MALHYMRTYFCMCILHTEHTPHHGPHHPLPYSYSLLLLIFVSLDSSAPLSPYTCLCEYICIYMPLYIHIYIHTFMHIYTHTCLVHIYTYIPFCIYRHIHTFMYTCFYSSIYIRALIHPNIYI